MALELPRYDKIPLDDKSSHSGSGVANYESITLTEESSSADDVTVSPSTSKKSVLGISLSVITFILCAFGALYLFPGSNGSIRSSFEEGASVYSEDLNRDRVGPILGIEGAPLSHLSVEYKKEEDLHFAYLHGRSDPLSVARFVDNIDSNGWNYLSVRSTMSPYYYKNSDNPSTYVPQREIIGNYLLSKLSMGYIEGFTTCEKIQDWYRNFYQGMFDGGDPEVETLNFLQVNHDWMIAQSDLYYEVSDYWLSVRGNLAQLHGMLAGIRAACPGVDEMYDGKERAHEHYILPGEGNMVQDFDSHSRWKGSHSGGMDDDFITSEEPSERYHHGIYLPSLHRRPSLIHLLLLNGNGDLYQIGAKYHTGMEPPYDDDNDDANDGTSKKTVKKTPPIDERASETLAHTDPVPPQVITDNPLLNTQRASTDKKEREKMKNNNNNNKENGGERYSVKQQYKIAKGRHIASEKSLVPDHCSALVKILPDYSDVLFGHVTWDDYQCAAPRIFKSFEYPYLKNNEPVGWYVTHFSSSPGMLSSVDDFYINRGTTYSAVMETSLDIYENDLLDKLQPLSVLAWMRTITANFLATGGDDWVKVFSTHASGTYSNQWMILDLNKFSAGQKPQAGFLTVLEEMPGYIHWEDMTDYITKSSYWPSYNNPYFQDIADISGQTDLCASDDMFCYDTDPRGQIFAAHQANIQTAEDFEKMLGYNHYETDPISQNNSCHAISCRMDLQPNVTLRYPFGAIDAKMSSYSLALPATADAITDYDHEYYGALSIPMVKSRFGMTHDTQEPFCWDKFKDKTDIRGKPFNHYGHPECFDYDWITLPPKINEKFR